jgi:hypothetical protein
MSGDEVVVAKKLSASEMWFQSMIHTPREKFLSLLSGHIKDPDMKEFAEKNMQMLSSYDIEKFYLHLRDNRIGSSCTLEEYLEFNPLPISRNHQDFWNKYPAMWSECQREVCNRNKYTV